MTNRLCAKTFFKDNSSMLSLYDGAKKTKKDIAENEAKKENQDETNEKPQKNKRVLKEAYKTLWYLVYQKLVLMATLIKSKCRSKG